MKKLIFVWSVLFILIVGVSPILHAEDCKCGVDEDGECLPC